MMKCGLEGKPVTFLMTDTQIVSENFLENINNVLNTGEITNLYEEDEYKTILDEITDYVKKLKRPESNDIKYATYVERVRDQFHIIMCMSPVGDALRIRCRMFPSLVNCCTLDWYDSWSQTALLDVSTKFIKEIDNLTPEVSEALSQMCMYTHSSVEQMAEVFYNELRRKVYITPKSYLDGINLYKTQLAAKRSEIQESTTRLTKGLSTLSDTKKQVAEL